MHAGGRGCKIPRPVFSGEIRAAKIQTAKGAKVEIFSHPVRKNTVHPLTVWIDGTDMEQGLFSAERYAIFKSVS